LLPNATMPPAPEHDYAQWQDKDIHLEPGTPSTSPTKTQGSATPSRGDPSLSPDKTTEDLRQCIFCSKYGDGLPTVGTLRFWPKRWCLLLQFVLPYNPSFASLSYKAWQTKEHRLQRQARKICDFTRHVGLGSRYDLLVKSNLNRVDERSLASVVQDQLSLFDCYYLHRDLVCAWRALWW